MAAEPGATERSHARDDAVDPRGDAPARDALSRRSVVRSAALGAGALALAAPARAVAQSTGGDDPSELLFDAIEISYALVLAYDPAAAFSDQPKSDAETLALFSVQSKAHADALVNAFELTSGSDPPDIPTSVGDSDLLSDLPTSPKLDDYLDKIDELEGQQISLFLEGAADRESPSLVRTFGEILSNCAQHQTVIRQLRLDANAAIEQAVPDAIIEATPDTTSQPDEGTSSDDSGS